MRMPSFFEVCVVLFIYLRNNFDQAFSASTATKSNKNANRSWVDSTDGIHAFLTFDSRVDPASIESHGNAIDYVWGASATTISAWRRSNPKIVLSYYMPFTRDPTPHTTKDHRGICRKIDMRMNVWICE